MARKKRDTRTTKCSHCGFEHYIQDGGWVVTANKKTYCYDETGGCHAKMRMLWTSNTETTSKETRTVGVPKDFDSW